MDQRAAVLTPTDIVASLPMVGYPVGFKYVEQYVLVTAADYLRLTSDN